MRRALSIYDQVIRIDEKNGPAFNNRGLIYLKARDYDHAIQDFTSAIDRDPSNVIAWNNRCATYNSKRDPDNALKDCDQAIQLNPKYSSAYVATRSCVPLQERAWTGRSKIMIGQSALIRNPRVRSLAVATFIARKRQYERAIDDYSKASELNPGDPEIWNNLCWNRALANQLERAREACDHSLQLRPNDAATLDSRGFVNLRAGDWFGAIEDDDSALKIRPNLDTSLYGRGVSKLKMAILPAAMPGH